jgi:integrase
MEIQKKHLKRAAKAAGIGTDIGWHTFRHAYRSWLDETGAPIKVQQELMRHASIQTTMNVYGQAVGSGNSELLIPEILSRSVLEGTTCSKFR